MEILFLCETCGCSRCIENPVSTRFPCPCGGTLFATTTQKAVKKQPLIAQVNPQDERTTLMSLALEAKKTPAEASDQLYKYKAVMCPKCGWIQVTSAEKNLKCRRCNKISTFRSKGRWNVRVKSFPTHEMACICAKEWSMEEGKNVKKI